MASKEARFSLSVYDNIGGGGTLLVHALVPEAATLTQAESVLGAIASAFTVVSGLGIKEASFGFSSLLEVTPVTGDPNAGSGAVFDFNNASNSTIFGLWVPGYNPADVLPNGTIDVTVDPALTFAAVFNHTGAPMGGTYTNAQYIANNNVVDDFYTNRKRKKRVRP